MANEEHVAILRQGVEVWNRWRGTNKYVSPDLRDIDLAGAMLFGAFLRAASLSRADLRGIHLHNANLEKADLSGANLEKADLNSANLREINLSGTNLREINLSGTNLRGADLRAADLRGANLRAADLRAANLSEANLSKANLHQSNLMRATLAGVIVQGANVIGSTLGNTIFGEVDLRAVHGLDTVHHRGPSTLGIDTLYRSQGNIPEIFLRGCGVPDSMIEYARSLVVAERPIVWF